MTRLPELPHGRRSRHVLLPVRAKIDRNGKSLCKGTTGHQFPLGDGKEGCSPRSDQHRASIQTGRMLIRLVPPLMRQGTSQQKRLAILGIVLATVMLVAAASWLVGSRIKSPAQIAAEASPPPAAPILVPVEKRIITSEIVTRGTARLALPQAVTLAPSAARPTEELISSLPPPHAQFTEGDVAFTVAGRPVFVLQGSTPAFRDLTPGTAGDDVLQLERALERLGFPPGSLDGAYDGNTAAAVAAWYTSSGWTPFAPTVEQMKEVHALTEQLAVAEKDHLAATLAARPQLAQAARAKAAANNEAAAADVAAKAATRLKVSEDPKATNEERSKAEADLTAARATLKATRQEGAIAVETALNAQKVAQREVVVAGALAARLSADLDRVQRHLGVQVPAREIMFVPSLPARIKQIDSQVGEIAKGPLLTIASTQVVIDSSLQLAEASLVKAPMPVKIDEPDLGITASGAVTRVADAPGTNGVDAFHVYLEVAVEETPTTLEGTSLRITIPVQSTQGAVLAVPVSAVSLAADGTSRVQVQKNGSLEYLTVKTGLSAHGFVEVTPVNGTLEPGQLVVIGFE